MAAKIKLTRPELKRYRDALTRYERYLPMLKLKQQQLQIMLREIAAKRREAERARDESDAQLARYRPLLADRAGVALAALARPARLVVSRLNIAGVEVPVFEDAVFPEARYSLFGTPAWVDRALADLRLRSRRQAALDVLAEEEALLAAELARIIQRVNLFEKVTIPRARDAVRLIRIRLGDEMTAAVGRAKIAKSKLAETLATEPGDAAAGADPEERTGL